jgi:hypothetical protein
MLDKVQVKEGLKVGLANYAPPGFPCPKCGKESKGIGKRGDAYPYVKRICASCRHEFLLNNGLEVVK